MTGVQTCALPIFVVVSHQIWTGDWRIIITILGWLLLIKGILRILFPGIVKKLIDKKRSDRRFLLSEVVVLLISLYLVYQGFIAY